MPVPFKLPHFYPILDKATLHARNCALQTAAEALFEAGVKILQYRHKGNWTQADFDEARQLAEQCQDLGILFVVNDRADLAKLFKSALHLGQSDLPPHAARAIVSDEILGFSTHNAAQLRRANEEPVEYVSLGPIFETQSKANPDPVVGLEGLQKCRGLTEKPLVAIGGITLENAKEVLNAKADSLAVISGLLPDRCDRKSLRRRAEEWQSLISK
jgi:thiamine-phosphate pyrophosphorylase